MKKKTNKKDFNKLDRLKNLEISNSLVNDSLYELLDTISHQAKFHRNIQDNKLRSASYKDTTKVDLLFFTLFVYEESPINTIIEELKAMPSCVRVEQSNKADIDVLICKDNIESLDYIVDNLVLSTISDICSPFFVHVEKNDTIKLSEEWSTTIKKVYSCFGSSNNRQENAYQKLKKVYLKSEQLKNFLKEKDCFSEEIIDEKALIDIERGQIMAEIDSLIIKNL